MGAIQFFEHNFRNVCPIDKFIRFEWSFCTKEVAGLCRVTVCQLNRMKGSSRAVTHTCPGYEYLPFFIDREFCRSPPCFLLNCALDDSWRGDALAIPSQEEQPGDDRIAGVVSDRSHAQRNYERMNSAYSLSLTLLPRWFPHIEHASLLLPIIEQFFTEFLWTPNSRKWLAVNCARLRWFLCSCAL